jgi:hypothetical protein
MTRIAAEEKLLTPQTPFGMTHRFLHLKGARLRTRPLQEWRV